MSNYTVAANRLPRLAVLAAGPILTALAVTQLTAGTDEGSVFALIALALWSPLFFSIPSLLLQGERDSVLSGLRGPAVLVRPLLVLPAMLLRSRVRTEMAASLLAWAVAVAMLGSSAQAALGQML